MDSYYSQDKFDSLGHSRNRKTIVSILSVVFLVVVGLLSLFNSYTSPEETSAEMHVLTTDELVDVYAQTATVFEKPLYENVIIIDGALYGKDTHGNSFLLITDDYGLVGVVFPDSTMTNAVFGVYKEIPKEGNYPSPEDIDAYEWYSIELNSGEVQPLQSHQPF